MHVMDKRRPHCTLPLLDRKTADTCPSLWQGNKNGACMSRPRLTMPMNTDAPRSAPPDAVATCSNCGSELVAGDRFCAGCGEILPDAAEAALLVDLQAVTLGEYDIMGKLGRGGMGIVYLAHEIALDRKVAIKVMDPGLLTTRPAGEATTLLERFRREARIAASLRHRHITSIFGLKETGKLLFFTMDYVEGRTLESIVSEAAPLPVELAQAIYFDIAGALDYAHAKDVTHRDIKPANIIIDTEGLAVVTDFGIAKIRGAIGLTGTGTAIGSPKYMSPEQWSGQATQFSDQYALGIVTHEMLSGKPPFDADTVEELMKMQLMDPPPELCVTRPECAPAFADAVMRMLRKDPAERWPTLHDATASTGVGGFPLHHPVRQRLAELARTGQEIKALPKTPRSPIPVSRTSLEAAKKPAATPRTSRTLRWLGLVAPAAAIGLALYLWLGRGSPLPDAPPVPPTTTESATSDTPPPQAVPVVGAVEVSPSLMALVVGETQLLRVRVLAANGQILSGRSVTWRSGDPSVASVQDGTVMANRVGQATITAESETRTANARITVRRKPDWHVSVAPTVEVGQTAQARADVTAADGSPLSSQVRWTTSNPDFATVSASGVVRGVGAGRVTITATITAESEIRTVNARITVRPMPLRVSVSVAPTAIEVGQTAQARADVTAADGSALSRQVGWTTSNPDFATVSESGVVRGVGIGLVTITATSEGQTGYATVTVTERVVDRRVLEEVLQAYERALESEDMRQLRLVYRGITSDDENAWQTAWQSWRNLTVTFRIDSLEADVDMATLWVSGTYKFRNTVSPGDESLPVTVQMTMQRDGSEWVIISVR